MLKNRVHVIAVAIALAICSYSSAATLVDFKPLPSSPSVPEFTFGPAPGPPGPPAFQAGPGSQGNGDGNLATNAQTPGGLDSETPFTLFAPVPGMSPNVSSTEFRDSTLVFNGLVASASAQNFFGTLIQPLGLGSFSLLSSDPDGPGGNPPVVLLTGNIGNATIVGNNTGSSGAVFSSATVNYTGGLIYNKLVATGANPNGNDMSFSMVDVTPGFSIPVAEGPLGNFTANGTGLFSYNPVPEPASAALMSLALVGMAIRRRR